MKASRQMSAAGTSRVSVASFHSDPGGAAASGRKTAPFLGTGPLRHLPSYEDFFSNVLIGGIPTSIPQGFGFKSRGAHHMSR